MGSLRDVQDDLRGALRQLESKTSFADVMGESTEGLVVGKDRRSQRAERLPRVRGAVFRAWAGDHWVEAATAGFDRAALGETVGAVASQLGTSARSSAPPGASPTDSLERSTNSSKPMRDVSADECLLLAKQLFDWSMAVQGIRDTQVQISASESERVYYSTAGCVRYQRTERTSTVVVPIAIENGKVEYDFLSHGQIGGRDVVDSIHQTDVTAVANEAVRLLNARTPPAGKLTVLLDPSTSGTLAHESFGHGTEADQFLRNRSYLQPILGQTVGPEFLTIVDDGAYPTGWGSIYFDDEGHPGGRAVLIDHGRFVQVLHDRETSAVLKLPMTANTRRANFLSRPFVRMTNTFVEPGEWALEELLEEAQNGVLLESCTSGIEDPLGGNMQIKVKKGRRIEHGKLTDLVSSMALSGKVLEVLRATKGVGRSDAFSMRSGSCGKGQTDVLPAGTGGSYLLTEAIVGPA